MDRTNHAMIRRTLALYYYAAVCLVQRSCMYRSFVATELVSLWDEESARTLGVLDVDR